MIYLKRLSLSDKDNIQVYEMLQEILPDDNGFHNMAYGIPFGDYQKWLVNEFEVDSGKLEEWMVPQSSCWLYDDNSLIGYGRVRHFLNEHLRKTSGHIGYAIRKSKRGMGYGNILLKLLLDECKNLGIFEIQISTNKDNISSNKIIKNNGGIFLKDINNKSFYKITLW